MDKLEPIHFSLADWLYQAGREFHASPDTFVSAPTSLARPISPTIYTYGNVALKESISGNLVEGRVVTWHKSKTIYTRYIWVYARAQTSPHLGDPNDAYEFNITATTAYLRKRVAGGPIWTQSAPITFTWTADTWHHFRFTWYVWLDANLQKAIRLVIDHEGLAGWVNQITYDDWNPSWEASPTNLIGLKIGGTSNIQRCYIDDTLIYRRSA